MIYEQGGTCASSKDVRHQVKVYEIFNTFIYYQIISYVFCNLKRILGLRKVRKSNNVPKYDSRRISWSMCYSPIR